jgi:hypothetical protein
MNVIWKAACVAALIAATVIELGCGETYRPISTPLPNNPAGNPSGPETEVVLNLCPTGSVCKDATGAPSGSVLTDIDVSGDTNTGNKPLYNTVASPVGPTPGSLASPLAFNSTRTAVLTANTATDSVTQSNLGISTAGFSANTTTISLPTGSAPIGISFQYFGIPYTQDYVVNSGTGTVNCPGTGSLSAILETTAQLAATVCVGQYSGAAMVAAANPVYAWIYQDQSKVFVLDNQPAPNSGNVYVVSASKYQVTNHFSVGVNPIKAAQSNSGQYIYVLNSGNAAQSIPGSISIIDGLTEKVVSTQPTSNPLSSAQPIDIAMDPNVNDTSANTQINHVWILHADGTVSVWDGTNPGVLNWITSVSTITPAQRTANPPALPTNLALMRDGTWAYVGVGNTNQIVGINTGLLASPGTVTPGVNATSGIAATTPITVDLVVGEVNLGSVTQSLVATNGVSHSVLVAATTPMVNSVAVSREGDSADLSKVYATTTTNTIYYCYDANVNPTNCANADPWDGTGSFLVGGCLDPTVCTNLGPVPDPGNPSNTLFAMTFPNLYNGTAVVTAAAIGTTPINRYVTTILAPTVVTYCNSGNPGTGEYDGQKNCPAMTPVLVLGRN